ncbi:MipA/OmpV family protein [Rheinheimera hassiensis]|uniref:MipA/OmpV family protein n=1 Tax=Rheinheimera hassiensis TaxID=1193627 RepID=UPI001F05F06E|nr:MipA/OmpV family protein [Rheinheimera hassiensis]
MKLSHYVLASVISTSMVCGTAMAQSAAPQGFSYGVGVGVNQEIYQGYSNRTIPLPIIGYQGDRLTVYGPFVSYKLLDLGNISFSAKLAPRFAGFDESDSAVFSGMAKRKDSIDGGIGMQLRQDSWKFEAQTVFDLLGNSKGQESKVSVGYSYRAGPIIIEPQFGVSYSDSKLVDYYYGVRPDEATAQRPAYKADGAVSYNAGVSFSTALFFGGMTRLGVEHHWYGSSISDSPLTDRDTGLSAFLSWSRLF